MSGRRMGMIALLAFCLVPPAVAQQPPDAAPPPHEKKGGLRGKIAENKKEEVPDAVKEAGRLSVVQPDAQGNVRIVIKDYLKPGDSLTLAANATTDRIGGVTVATFTEKAKDAVGLKVAFGAFADGTVYPATIQLNVASQNLAIAIENSGYKKSGS